MAKTIEAIIDQDGNIHLLESVHLSGSRRALVTILEEEPKKFPVTALLSQQVLAEDWLKAEEDRAWAHLQ